MYVDFFLSTWRVLPVYLLSVSCLSSLVLRFFRSGFAACCSLATLVATRTLYRRLYAAVRISILPLSSFDLISLSFLHPAAWWSGIMLLHSSHLTGHCRA